MRPASAKPASNALAGEYVVFTGRLSSLSRHDARALVSRFGGTPADEVNAKATMLVVGAAGGERRGAADAEREKSRKILRAEAINSRHPGRIRILTEDQFCELAGVPSPAALRQQWYSVRDVLAMYPLLREDHLRYLQKWNLIRPALRTHAETYFSFPDLAVFRQAHGELERGAPFRSVLRSLLASRQGQLRLDFRADAAPARLVHLGPKVSASRVAPSGEADTNLAEQLFLIASALDDGNPLDAEACARAYRQALEADPNLVPAIVNLGNVHYTRGELVEAEALYQRAMTIDDDHFESRFNLGNVYHDLGRLDEAEHCYTAALELNPAYADAHFYLAVTREKQGRSDEARPHWRRYLELAPDGEWAGLARELSEQ